MSKLSDLDIMIEEIETIGKKMIIKGNEMVTDGEGLVENAKELRTMFSSKGTNETVADVNVVNGKDDVADVKKYTREYVRGLMAKLPNMGMKDKAIALLNKYGANRLSDVKEEDYPSLVKDLEELLNG